MHIIWNKFDAELGHYVYVGMLSAHHSMLNSKMALFHGDQMSAQITKLKTLPANQYRRIDN